MNGNIVRFCLPSVASVNLIKSIFMFSNFDPKCTGHPEQCNLIFVSSLLSRSNLKHYESRQWELNTAKKAKPKQNAGIEGQHP